MKRWIYFHTVLSDLGDTFVASPPLSLVLSDGSFLHTSRREPGVTNLGSRVNPAVYSMRGRGFYIVSVEGIAATSVVRRRSFSFPSQDTLKPDFEDSDQRCRCYLRGPRCARAPDASLIPGY